MREDMYKVIVERPRRGGGVQGEGRIWRNSRDRGSHLGMKRGYGWGKHLNENLAPLKRWLHKQVHRPWDKVYAELCGGIDRRNTVQAHIHEHIDGFVARFTTWEDGEVVLHSNRGWHGGPERLCDARHVELFVHPLTGILLPNRASSASRAAWSAQQKAAGKPATRRIDIDDWTQWHCLDGDWFEIALELLPPATAPSPGRWDALLKQQALRGRTCPPGTLDSVGLYGRANVYAVSKRRIGRAEFRRRFPNGMPGGVA
ncbi:hypothetical protein QTI66_25655 [Variovorax sp. J22R133]|uniref:hypothetical protein n=1 Tax=Variovorax brevis TaxID=3053503 RepID=UPI0025760724|nr:hypothetical protein [Variovorax sp. J22R133]MDM0115561.1 hypothetical protein [Variovorax sp. J22R133]